MIDSANVDVGLKDWTKGLSVGLENWAGDMTGQLMLINEKLQNLVDLFKGPDASTLNESSLESPDQEGKVPKPEKGGVFGKAFKGIKSLIEKFGKWKTLIIGALTLIIAGLGVKYWEPIKKFVVDKIIPAIEKIVEVLKPIVESIKEWTTNTLLPTVMDYFFNNIESMKKLFENVVARFEGWGEMDFKEKVFAILGVFEDLGTYIADVGRNMLVAIGDLFGVDGEALATKYFDPIRKVFSDLIDWVKLAFTDPKAALSALWNGLLGGAATIGGWIFDNAIKPSIEWVMGKFAAIGDLTVQGWTTLKDFITGIYTDTIDFWKKKFAAIGDLVVKGWTNLKDFVTGIYEGVVLFFQDIFRWSRDIVVQGFHNLTDFIISIYNKVVEFFTRMFTWGGDIVKKGWTGLTTFVTGVYDKVIEFFTRIFTWGGDIVKKGWTGLTTFVTGVYDSAVNFVKDKLAWGGDIVKEGWTGLNDFVSGTYDSAVNFVKDKLAWGGDVVKEGWTGLTDFVSGAYDSAVNFVKDKLAWGGDVVKEGWTGLTDFATSSYDGAVGFMQDKLAWGGDVVKEGWSGLTNFATGSYDGAVGFFKDKLAFASDKMEGFSLFDTIAKVIKDIKNYFWNDQGTGLLNFDFEQILPEFSFDNLFGGIADMFSLDNIFTTIGKKIASMPFDFVFGPSIKSALLKIFDPKLATAADYIADPKAKVYAGPEVETNAAMANKVFSGPRRGAGMNVVNAPQTNVDASSASSTVNVFTRGRPGASDGYTLSQGRNQRSRFSN
jgi:phage-related protein